MDEAKKTRTMYWFTTVIFLLPNCISGIAFLAGAPQALHGMMALGYPLYMLKMLGVAKLLGAAAIIMGRAPRLKEWAYAGFTFDMIGATVSHLSVGQLAMSLNPAILWLVMLMSYAYWKKMQHTEVAGASAAAAQYA